MNRKNFFTAVKKDFIRNKNIYLLALPVLIWYAIFMYGPMYGAQIAFKNFSPALGIAGSKWVGLKHFLDFFQSFYFARLLMNTLLISIYGLIFVFPAPIILALLLNELRNIRYRRFIQTITYIPHFISVVVVCGLIVNFLKTDGLISVLISNFGGENRNLLLDPSLFRTIYISTEIWQQVGWSSIIYLAALASIDMELFDAAKIDGANRWRQVWHITLPGILPTIVILLILRLGTILNVGFEKVMLLYNPSTYITADVISTFVYRRGILEANFSYSAAVGLFNSVLTFILVILSNMISKKTTAISLW